MVAPTKDISTIALPSTHGGVTAGASLTSVRSSMIWTQSQVSKDRSFWGVGLDAASFTLADPRFLLVDNDGNVKAAVAAPASFVWEASWLPLWDGSVLILGSYNETFDGVIPTIWRVVFNETTGSGTCTDTGYQTFGGSLVLGVSGGGTPSALTDKNGLICLPGISLTGGTSSGRLLVIDTGKVSGTISVRQSATWSPLVGTTYMYLGEQPLPDGRWYCTAAHEFGASSILVSQYYDPSADTWSAAPNSPTAGRSPTCLTHPKGLFILATADRLNEAWWFNPDTLAWVAITPRTNNAGAGYYIVLPDGRIIVNGSAVAGIKNQNDIYDPAQDTWTALPNYPASNAVTNALHYYSYGSDGQLHWLETRTTSPYDTYAMSTQRIGGCGVPPTASQSATQVSLIPHADPGVDGVHFGIDPIAGAYVTAPAVASDLTVTVVSETLHSLES
jgi:hypothetical protein